MLLLIFLEIQKM